MRNTISVKVYSNLLYDWLDGVIAYFNVSLIDEKIYSENKREKEN